VAAVVKSLHDAPPGRWIPPSHSSAFPDRTILNRRSRDPRTASAINLDFDAGEE
jgi:hypothetical protein